MLAGKKRSLSTDPDISALHKECDEALCPICMEHPHNAVLLLCSSHGKGCRPYICDTSYRHSNCLDRYRKLSMDSNPSPSSPEMTQQQPPSNTSEDGLFEITDAQNPRRGKMNNLKCPLCRGDVQGWKVIEEAREYLNIKTRSCSRESCSFVGNYSELRKHARSQHPCVIPAEVDQSRQQAWRRFEHQREYNDIVSAIQSAIPGAVVFGDYVIENENSNATAFLTFQMLGSMESRGRSRGTAWSRHRRSNGRRYFWGENLLRMRYESDGDNDEDVNVINAGNDDLASRRRRRRRLTQTRSSRDQL